MCSLETNRICCTDARTGLASLPDESVDCIVTSPPYWQMRDYGTEPLWWEADSRCPHEEDAFGYCPRCGGWHGELGHEPAREEYIAHLLALFGECRRVLKATGSLWVNIADSYGKPYKYNVRQKTRGYTRSKNGGCLSEPTVDKRRHRVAAKSLCNIPGRFAEEMIADGWILRNEIIWHKPACVPSPAKDRFTVDYEKMFFFVKNRRYLFNRQFEPYAKSSIARYRYPMTSNGKGAEFQRIAGTPKGMMKVNPEGRTRRCVWSLSISRSKERHYAMFPEKLVEIPIRAGSPENGIVLDPFAGAGTTAVAAKRLGRRYIAFEPNAQYAEIARKRCAEVV